MKATSQCKNLGAFYTPNALAEWVASEILEAAAAVDFRVRHVVDPACGAGALLGAMHRLSREPVSLTGIDINPAAAYQSAKVLDPMSDIIVEDALGPDCQWGKTPPDAVIANPPWGGGLSHSRKYYRQKGYHLASGQFDISDLFVERALNVAPPGALLGLILPDSVFQPDHQALREMLLQHTLLLIARLGEGIFEDVYRSTVVLVLRRGSAKEGHTVKCLQVPASKRKLLGRGAISFREVKEFFSHDVPQSRFANNAGYAFDIAQTEFDYGVFQKFSARQTFSWSPRVHIGRGVEIGKRGITVCCAVCGNHRAAPVTLGPVSCPACTALIAEDTPRHAIIADFTADPEWHPIIVGEDVDRYSATPRRFIKLGVRGIRYKPMEHFASTKLLIRKTGVGLRAAVDQSGAATTQTVYYVVAKSREDDWILDYLQGVINSRPMLAWYLRWSGENQWRSHPYVTPTVLKRLPIPDPFTDERLAQVIAKESKLARKGVVASDHAVDDLVGELYELDEGGAMWVNNTLADTEEQLEYFARMRNGAVNSAFGRVSPKVSV